MHRWVAGLCAAAATLWAAGVARADESLTYVLTPDFERGVLSVSITWQTQGRDLSALRVSQQWGTIPDITALLRNVSFAGASVEPRGPMWVLRHAPGAVIRCTYEVDAGARQFDDWKYTHHPIVTRDFFHGSGNAFLMSPNPGGPVPETYEALLRWELPAGHKAVCSWGAGRSVAARMKAADLRQSVYLAGRIETLTVPLEGSQAEAPATNGAAAADPGSARGPRITVAMVDRFGFSIEDFAKMTAAIVARQCEFMQESDFPDFVVTAIPVGEALKEGDSRLSGVGLYHSFSLCVAPEAKLTDAVELLFSHELFHHWNGRILEAADPERLVFWFVEGMTDYYSMRILFESGYWDAATYAKWLNKQLREYALNPEAEATNEEIHRAFWSARSTVGEAAYQRGQALGLRWRHLARQKGRGGDNFDALLRTLISRARIGGFKLTNDVIRKTGIERLGPWFGDEFDSYVTGARVVEIPPGALAPKLKGTREDVYEFAPGFDMVGSLKAKRVTGVEPGSAAAAAGLKNGDELAGWTVHNDPDRKLRLGVRRGGKVTAIEFYPRGKKRVAVQFTAG